MPSWRHLKDSMKFIKHRRSSSGTPARAEKARGTSRSDYACSQNNICLVRGISKIKRCNHWSFQVPWNASSNRKGPWNIAFQMFVFSKRNMPNQRHLKESTICNIMDDIIPIHISRNVSWGGKNVWNITFQIIAFFAFFICLSNWKGVKNEHFEGKLSTSLHGECEMSRRVGMPLALGTSRSKWACSFEVAYSPFWRKGVLKTQVRRLQGYNTLVDKTGKIVCR